MTKTKGLSISEFLELCKQNNACEEGMEWIRSLKVRNLRTVFERMLKVEEEKNYLDWTVSQLIDWNGASLEDLQFVIEGWGLKESDVIYWDDRKLKTYRGGGNNFCTWKFISALTPHTSPDDFSLDYQKLVDICISCFCE